MEINRWQLWIQRKMRGRHLHGRSARLSSCTDDIGDTSSREHTTEINVYMRLDTGIRQLDDRIYIKDRTRITHQHFVVGQSKDGNIMMPIARSLHHRHLELNILAAINDEFRRSEPLHTLVGCYPFSTSHISIRNITFKIETDATRFLRRED